MAVTNYFIKTWNVFISFFDGVGVKDSDSDFEKLQKAILTANAFLVASLAIFWSATYFLIGLTLSGIIPFSYAIISYISIILFKMSKKFTFFKNSQLIMTLLLPYLLMFSLGGFENSSVVIMWAIIGPIGGLLFGNYKRAHYLLSLFLVLLIISGYEESLYLTPPFIRPEIINLFFVLNVGGVTIILFVIVLYFVDQRAKAFTLLNSVVNNSFSNLIDNLKLNDDLASGKNIESVLFMIITAGGLAKYSKIFSDSQKYNDQLIAGFLSAINAFSQETFGTNFLKQISYKDFYLLFDTIKDYKFVYAFKGDQSIAEKNLSIFKTELTKSEFGFVFVDDTKEIEDDSILTELVKRCFNTN